MKILFLAAWCPLPADNGVRQRLSNLIRGLARRNELHLLCFAPEHPGEQAERELREICAEVELIAENPFAGQAVRRLTGLLSPMPRSLVANHRPTMAAAVRARAGRGFDAVIGNELHMLPYVLLMPGAARIIDALELTAFRDRYLGEANPARRARAYLTWWKLARYLRSALGNVSGVAAVSQSELDLLRGLMPSKVATAIVANGVDTAAYSGDFGAPEPDLLIYPGSLNYAPNLEAVRYFAGDILPRVRAVRPQARLLVTGRASPEEIAALPKVEGLEVAGYLPDVRPALARAWAEVVPLRSGSGTRLKILEALAIGTPVISTSKGAEGLDLQPERDLLIADEPAEFAAQTLRVLNSAELRGRLSARGRLAAAPYDWSASVAALEDLIARAGVAA